MPKRATFVRVERADLEDDARLSELYVDAVRRGWWPRGPTAVLDFWALAEKALQEDSHGTPGRLFHSLVKSKERGRITDGQEQRAQRRMPSHVREVLVARAAGGGPEVPTVAQVAPPAVAESDPVDAAADLWATDPDRVVYHHSIMMMCFLPQKRLPADQRHYVVRHGLAALRIEAGTLIDPAEVGTFRPFPVPFGSRARLILPYINGYALRHQTRTVDLGRSLRAFMTHLGLSFDGRRGHQIMEQVQSLAAAHLVLGLWDTSSGRSHAHLATVADEISFWNRARCAPALALGARDDPLAALLRCDHGAICAARHGASGAARSLTPPDGRLCLAHLSHRGDSAWPQGARAACRASAGVRPRCVGASVLQAPSP